MSVEDDSSEAERIAYALRNARLGKTFPIEYVQAGLDAGAAALATAEQQLAEARRDIRTLVAPHQEGVVRLTLATIVDGEVLQMRKLIPYIEREAAPIIANYAIREFFAGIDAAHGATQAEKGAGNES